MHREKERKEKRYLIKLLKFIIYVRSKKREKEGKRETKTNIHFSFGL